MIYRDEMGEVYADRAQVDYIDHQGSLKATKILLYDNIRLVNLGSEAKPASQYALADEVVYYPEEQVMLLEGKHAKVLFYDEQRDLQISARTIRAHKNKETKKESVQGVGDVAFSLGLMNWKK